MPAGDEHLQWLVQNRSRNQTATLELYSLMRTFGEQLKYHVPLQEAAQSLTAVAFSLWRAVFLSELSGDAAQRMLHVEIFLRRLIADNTVVYQTDKESREWTYRYYIDNARLQLTDICQRSMPGLAAINRPTTGPTNERDEWELIQAALEEAIANFGRTLAATPIPGDPPPS